MTETPRRSNAWPFIIAAAVALILLLASGTTLINNSDSSSASSLPPSALFSFVIACAALGFAIAANASAYLNPVSPRIMRFISPIILVIAAVLIIPFFISLGLAMVGS